MPDLGLVADYFEALPDVPILKDHDAYLLPSPAQDVPIDGQHRAVLEAGGIFDGRNGSVENGDAGLRALGKNSEERSLEEHMRDWVLKKIANGASEDECRIPFMDQASRMVDCRLCGKSVASGMDVLCTVRGCAQAYHKSCARINLGFSGATEFKCPQHMAFKLLFAVGNPPLSAILAARVADVQLELDSTLPAGSLPELHESSGSKWHGATDVLRQIARAANIPNFFPSGAVDAEQVDKWLDYAPAFSSGADFEKACEHVDLYLLKQTFLVGSSLSVADIAIWSGLAGTGQRWDSLRKSKKYQNLVRWYNSIASEYGSVLKEVIDVYVGKRGLGKPKAVKPKEVEITSNTKSSDRTICPFDVELPGAEVGNVVLRFAPEPSGYLHIGHSKAALLNQYFAKKYQGRLIVRFDDTNPAKESNEFVENILLDIDTLGIKYEKVTYTSDYFPDLMRMAEKLINDGKAYVDDTPREQMQKERMDGIESKCRNTDVLTNLALWKEMIAGTDRGLQCCLRGKLDMQALNKSLRDPVYYRSNPVPHHRIGKTYKVYPTYDFACPLVDAHEGITHALRSSEYHDRNEQYYRILEDMGVRRVQVYEFSRLNLVYTLLSKRKLSWFVEHGKVDGWDDPRFPTVQGMVRRGLTVEALLQFILSQGASKNLNLMEWDKLWTINKKLIDPICPRHTAVLEEGRVILTLTDGPEKPFVRIIPRHKKYEGAGQKATTYTKRIWIEKADASAMSEGVEITLMDWGNAIIKEIQKDGDGNVTHLTGVLHLEGSVKTTKLKLTWLAETSELVNLSLVDLDYLITKKKLEEGEDFLDVLKPCTKRETLALGDSNMRNLQRGEILQLERKGYYRCDAPFVRPSKPIVLIAIPDGRQQAPVNLSKGLSNLQIS